MANYTKPLKELIAELQKIEDSHPGINCTFDDSHFGAGTPTVEIANSYSNNLEQPIVIPQWYIDQLQKKLEYYSQSPQEMWETIDKTAWADFESFEKKYHSVKEKTIKELKNIENSSLTVVVKINLC